ncbi:MAG: sugar O-acetyltransferase [Phycisphaerae bacterium]
MTTAKHRMLAGELYDPQDPLLAGERRHARTLLDRLNKSLGEPRREQHELLRQLLGAFGKDAHVEPPFFCDYGYNVRLGAGAYLNCSCVLLDTNVIDIGERTLLGPAVQVYAAQHPLNAAERAGGLERGLAVTIGADCWIGGGAILVPGVSVGAGTVVGAGSVVVKDLPAGVLAVGNPARVVRSL